MADNDDTAHLQYPGGEIDLQIVHATEGNDGITLGPLLAKTITMFCAPVGAFDGIVNVAITVPEVPFGVVPKEHQCKTFMSPLGSDLERHSSVCNEVCRSGAVYQWMLRYL